MEWNDVVVVNNSANKRNGLPSIHTSLFVLGMRNLARQIVTAVSIIEKVGLRIVRVGNQAKDKRNERNTMFFIGSARRFLFVPWNSWWNAFVRDITAKLEGTWLIRSKQ